MKNIFVYGTLKKGYGNHRLLRDCEFVEEFVVPGFKLFESGIPYMKRTGNPDDKVLGEVYKVDNRSLQYLDQLEGHPDWYRREVVVHESPDTVDNDLEGYVYLPEVHCPESPKVDGVYVYGRERRY
jgi:gamma-glutamylcyclotransferase (GGCT)/AIG2-like uncharacterized protein YtfP